MGKRGGWKNASFFFFAVTLLFYTSCGQGLCMLEISIIVIDSDPKHARCAIYAYGCFRNSAAMCTRKKKEKRGCT